MKAAPVTINVPQDYPTVQDAISHASPGDTIHVSSGTYNETLFIDKALTLVGEDKESTFLVNNGTTVVQVNLTSIIISGFTIMGNGNGIVLEHCNGSTIRGNHIICSKMGVWLHYSDHNVVYDNFVSDSVSSCAIVLCGGSSDNNITCNTLKNSAHGIELTGTNNRIYHNNFINNQNQTVMINSFKNAWNNSCEGNYWSDYFGTGFNEYGIGNTPYVIDTNNTDNHPLRSPYMVGDVNHDAKVNIIDIYIIARAFGTQPGNSKWNPYADIDENNVINIVDIFGAAKNFRMEWH